ncbi:MAG: PilX N-terminal domain-containing pilus assembly protein [Candidatus Methylomirabilales bacterium]
MGITNKKMRITLPWALGPVRDERGIALVVALLVSALLLLLGGHFMTASMTEKTISSNEVNTARAFYLAEAGVQHAKKSLEALDLSAVLNGTPVFAGGNAVNLAGGSYAVQVTNNIAANGFPRGTIAADPSNSGTVDGDKTVVVTSTATFRNSQQIVETVLQKSSSVPTIPGAVVQVSNGWNDLDVGGTISGFDESGTCTDQAGHFHRGSTVIIQGNTVTGNPDKRKYDSAIDNPIWNDPKAVVDMVEKWMNDPAAVKITGDTPPKELGKKNKPQITVWDPTSTDTDSNNKTSFEGYGILIMVGRVNLKTSFEFHGLIVAYGGKEMAIEGGNGQVLHGAILAANNDPSPSGEATEVGVLNGTKVNYNCDAIKQYVEPLGGGGSGAVNVLSWRPR